MTAMGAERIYLWLVLAMLVLGGGLVKMLVGATSWPGRGYPEYGRFARYGRKEITFGIDVLVQQGVLSVDG